MSRSLKVGAVLLAAAIAATSCSQTSETERSPTPTGAPSIVPTGSTTSAASPAPTPSPGAGAVEETWARSLAFSPEAVTTDREGDVYVTGFAPYGLMTDTGRQVAMVLAKAGPDGVPIWTRRWKSRDEMFTDAAGFDVAVSPDGDVVYVSGETLIPPWEARLVRLWAYSADGELLWTRQTDRFAFGATVAAISTGAVLGGSGWLGAWSEAGDRLWTTSFEEPAGEHCDEVADLATGERDEVIAIGFLDTTPTCGSVEGGDFQDADVVIQRRSASGDLVWSRILDDPEVENDWGRSVDVIEDSIYVAGEVDGRAWTARLSGSGDIVWDRPWGAPGMVVRIAGLAADARGVSVLADRGPLLVRRYTSAGELLSEARLRLGLVAEGLAIGPDGAVYVIAGDSEASGELRRIRP